MSFADLTDVRMYYQMTGTGDPLLLIPGLGATTDDWDPSFEAATKNFTLILPDTRGSGRSEAKRKANRLHHYSADLIELMDHLNLERAHVLGISLGGIIAQRFAIDHPNRIHRLVLMSCADRFGPYLQEMARLIGNMVGRFPSRLFCRFMHMLGTGPAYIDKHPELLDARERGEQSVDRRAVMQQLRALVASDPDPHAHERITSPTLVIAGEDDVIVPQSYQRQMAEQIPEAQFVRLDGVGHNPLAECPKRVLPMIMHFLSTGELISDESPSAPKDKASTQAA
jgi:3-oxoadipate enol-lactonase